MGSRTAMPRRAPTTKRLNASANRMYTSRIIKAGALIADTKTLLSYWDLNSDVSENLNRIRSENIFAKASRSRVDDILAVFRYRYLLESEVVRALVLLVNCRLSSIVLDRILYFHTARADTLLHDAVTEILMPMQAQGNIEVDAAVFNKMLSRLIEKGLVKATWSEKTTLRVAQGLLSTLRDFGVLQGAVNKRIAPAYVPVPAFAYIAFYLKMHQLSGAKLLEHPDWKLFFFSPELVERFLLEANQHELLEYHAAGSVTRLTFPAATLEEYANVLAQKSH